MLGERAAPAGWNGRTGRLERVSGSAVGWRAQDRALAALFDHRLLQAAEVAQYIQPFGRDPTYHNCPRFGAHL
jgi:hypothetical protein